MTTTIEALNAAEEALEDALPFIGYSAFVPDLVLKAERALHRIKAAKVGLANGKTQSAVHKTCSCCQTVHKRQSPTGEGEGR